MCEECQKKYGDEADAKRVCRGCYSDQYPCEEEALTFDRNHNADEDDYEDS